MKKHFRIAAAAAVLLVALGAVGYSLRGHGSASPSTKPDVGAPTDDVTKAIDQALGRTTQTSVGGMFQTTAQNDASAPSKAVPPAPNGSPAAGALSAAPASPSSDPSLASVDDRKIVQTGSIRLQVKDVSGGFADVQRIASAAGGFVASSNFGLQGDQQTATVTIRVPADRYQDVLSQVRAVGAKVDGEASNASDVTDEYTDLGGRLRALQATQQQLLQLLGQAKTVADVLQVQDRLNSVQTQIEQTQGRINLLDRLSDMATLTVQLRPVVAASATTTGGHDLASEASRAWEHSLDFLGGIAAGVLSVVVFSWWLALIALPAALVVSRWLRGRPHAATPASYD